MRNNQLLLVTPAAPLEGFIAALMKGCGNGFLTCDALTGHPHCDAETLATILTGDKEPRFDRDSWERFYAERLFRAMFQDPTLTFARALEVWEHPNFRKHMNFKFPPTDGLRELFLKLSREEQFRAIKARIANHGAENGDFFHHNLLDQMFSWLPFPEGSTGEHLQRLVGWALSRNFHNPKGNAETFLTALRLMKGSLES